MSSEGAWILPLLVGSAKLEPLQERLKLVDGELSIDAQVLKGTEVRATIPLISKAAVVKPEVQIVRGRQESSLASAER